MQSREHRREKKRLKAIWINCHKSSATSAFSSSISYKRWTTEWTHDAHKRGDRESAVIGATCEIYAAKKSLSGLGQFHDAATCNRTCWCWWWDDRWQHGWGWGCDLIRLSLNLVSLNAAAALLSFRPSQIAHSHCEGFHYVLWYSQHFTLSPAPLSRICVYCRIFVIIIDVVIFGFTVYRRAHLRFSLLINFNCMIRIWNFILRESERGRSWLWWGFELEKKSVGIIRFFIVLNVDILVNCSSVKEIRDILSELKRVKEF